MVPIFYIFSLPSFVSLQGNILESKVEHGKSSRHTSTRPLLLPDWPKFAQGKDVDIRGYDE